MSFDVGTGINTAGSAAALGANPYVAAAAFLAGAFGAGDSNRLPKISPERGDLEGTVAGIRLRNFAAEAGIHPLAAIGANSVGQVSEYIPGQNPLGSIAKAVKNTVQDVQMKKESDARIALLKAQAKALENQPAVNPVDVPVNTQQVPVPGQVAEGPASEVIVQPDGSLKFTGRGDDAETYERRLGEIGQWEASIRNYLYNARMVSRYKKAMKGKGTVVSDGVLFAILPSGQLEELAVVGKALPPGHYRFNRKGQTVRVK